jgi:hypothetical protein
LNIKITINKKGVGWFRTLRIATIIIYSTSTRHATYGERERESAAEARIILLGASPNQAKSPAPLKPSIERRLSKKLEVGSPRGSFVTNSIRSRLEFQTI